MFGTRGLARMAAIALTLAPVTPLIAQETPRAGAATQPVAQDGATAESIRQVLNGISLPEGFRIALYAVVPGARNMAVGPDGKVVIVGTRGKDIWALTDPDSDGTAEDVRRFAPDLDLDIPHGVDFAADGTLYLAERNRVLAFPNAETLFDSSDLIARPVVPQDALIPPSEESSNHTSRVITVGPDDRLYISLGQPYNVTPQNKLALFDEIGIGGIIRLNRDGSGREVFTRGVRNSVGQDFHPVTGEFWFTDNQVDGMGDDIPPGEINRQTAAGQHFGFPWYGGGAVRTHAYAGQDVPVDVVMPASETVAHAADLGMVFYTGDMFPARYRNAIFSAQRGSWNRSERIGARVMVSFPQDDGTARTEPFAEGWLTDSGRYDGRPVDVVQMPDGALLVSDDLAGAVYRISYEP